MKEQLLAVQRMQDYIEEHWAETISLADLARASLYSPWYSYRLFQKWLHLTPAEYIRKLRLSKSALRLRDERVKVLDVALESGFDSVDGYQRAFCREFGCNPQEYGKHPIPLYWFHPYGIKYLMDEEAKTMEQVKSVFVQVIEKPARKVIVKRGKKAEQYFDYCEEVGCDVWGLLLSIKSLAGEPVCLWLPEQYRTPGTSKYVQGVEVALDYDGIIPDGFDDIEFPASQYLMFQGEPFAEETYEQAIQQVWTAIEKYDPSVLQHQWDDQNPRIQLEPIGSRGYIELLPIR